MMEYKGAYTITFLGSTAHYEVYEVVLYPALLNNEDALAAYKQQLTKNLVRIKTTGRKGWGVIDVSRLSVGQIISLTYRLALPFVRAPMVVKSYGRDPFDETAFSEDTRLMVHIFRIAFRYALLPSREAALPPDFVPNVANDTEATE